MTDWTKIEVPQFMELVLEDEDSRILVGRIVIDRLPYTFETKKQYFTWRDELAEGIQVDARDIIIVGSAATGRSLSAKKKFGVFGSKSDVDIAVVSSRHFDIAWQWFRRVNVNLLNLDDEGLRLFEQHRKQYIFNGMIAANYFLNYLPFGTSWVQELQRCEKYLPSVLRGRKMSVRIYKDNEALREAQMAALNGYRTYLAAKKGS
ncbi:hypothetical protein [Micromonospora thermarum]|uniref:Polymerase nucleotidyl transferase domain-containing protein n=1 Tax=Micromonospora thermarum TaxID=2720024 RepID=A0ABX0ZFC0_9ACTN|nr:hypothetical protein [Micromonospora thermarum]NJP35718.1 hypothetical protein [Micromonospora thermarum]